jgi:hypothetical protein
VVNAYPKQKQKQQQKTNNNKNNKNKLSITFFSKVKAPTNHASEHRPQTDLPRLHVAVDVNLGIRARRKR